MSHQATAWALYDVRPGTVTDGARFTLLALADHARPDGTGAWPYVANLAELLGTSERTVYRHLAQLEEAGLIRPGDQALVEHYPADKRPRVWDLAMPKRPDARVTPRPDRSVTPSTTMSPRDLTPAVTRNTLSNNTSQHPSSTQVSPDRAHGMPQHFRELVEASRA